MRDHVIEPTRGRVIKLIICLFVFVVLIFCVAQVFSVGAAEEASEVIPGGKVPVNYMATDAYSETRLAEGKAMFDAKCALCHTDSGRDMVYFGDPDFNSARVIGSVKKFVGAATDPEIGEKVFEYLRYMNDGPFQSQNMPFLQPGPTTPALGVLNPILSRDIDFWGSLTGHKVPTPDDINIEKIYNSYDMTNVALPYPIASWSEFMPHEVPLETAVNQTRGAFNMQGYDLTNLPLKDDGLGVNFGRIANSIYDRNQFSSHDYARRDHSKDAIEAVYSTSFTSWLGVLDFEYGLPQRVNGEWNGEWAWGPGENTILWGPGSNLDNINNYGINQFENISSREALRNKWTQYSTMFVTGTRGSFTPNAYFWYATMPWGCKTFDAGTFGGPDVQLFTGIKGFAEMWNHTKEYPGVSYPGFGMQSIKNYGAATRKYLTDMYWMFEGLPYYSGNKAAAANVFTEVIYRQWMAAIGTPDAQFRTLISDSYNLPDGQRDAERYNTLIRSFANLQSAMTSDQQDLVKAYIRRLYPTNPSGYASPFNAASWSLVDPAPTKPVVLPFGSDTAVVGESYVLRILRAQASDGDIEITASNLPAGAELIKKTGSWQVNDFEYAISWTPTSSQARQTFKINLTATSNMGTTDVTTEIKVVAKAAAIEMDDIANYSVYAGQELSFPLTVKNDNAEGLTYAVAGTFGKVVNNAWNTAGIYTVHPVAADVGTHTLTFTVKDAQGNMSTKTAAITVNANSVPVVTMTTGSGPGANKNIYRVRVGETLRLTFNVTDADGDRVEISKNPDFPGTVFGNTYTYTPDELMAQNFPGPNVLTFTIKDMASSGNPYSLPTYKGGIVKKVLLVYFETADSNPNHTPWAVTGPAQNVNGNQKVTLDGSGSDDSDKDPITYRWTQESGPLVKLSSTTSAKPTFIAPVVTTPTVLKFYLYVTDPGGLTDATVVRVTVGTTTVPTPAWSDSSEWAVPYLEKADKAGLIPTILKGADMTKPITRAEFAALSVKLYESLSKKTATASVTNPFTDTTDTEILKAVSIGITNGTSDTTFSPNALITREQTAIMLTRAYKAAFWEGWTLAGDSTYTAHTLDYTGVPVFADDASISSFAKSSVYFMVKNNIIGGVGNNMFAPNTTNVPAGSPANYGQATREQAIKITVVSSENLK